MSEKIKNTIDWWKELTMIRKAIMSIAALFTTLVAGGGSYAGIAGIDVLQRIDSVEVKVSIVAEELIKSNYEFEKEKLTNDIKEYKDELRGIRSRCGGTKLPDCDEIEAEDYNEALEAKNTAKDKLKALEKKMEDLKEEKLKKIKEGKE